MTLFERLRQPSLPGTEAGSQSTSCMQSCQRMLAQRASVGYVFVALHHIRCTVAGCVGFVPAPVHLCVGVGCLILYVCRGKLQPSTWCTLPIAGVGTPLGGDA